MKPIRVYLKHIEIYGKRTIEMPAFVFFGAALIVLIGVAYFAERSDVRYDRAAETLSSQEVLITKLIEDVRLLKIQVEELVAGAAERTRAEIARRVAEEARLKELENKLTSETEKRVALENQVRNDSGLSSARLSQIEAGLSNKYDLPAIISEWRKRTANIRCEFTFGSATGSGIIVRFLEDEKDVYGILTNKHVLTDVFGSPARSCTVRFPELVGEIVGTSARNEIQVSTEGYDFGRILVPAPSPDLRNVAIGSGSYCSARPNIGDELIIIGYPIIGSNEDITATEGIISGFESDYFVTSAKVERGNSGGTAVLLKQNCFLGVPTFVQSGALESLARILNINVLDN